MFSYFGQTQPIQIKNMDLLISTYYVRLIFMKIYRSFSAIKNRSVVFKDANGSESFKTKADPNKKKLYENEILIIL